MESAWYYRACVQNNTSSSPFSPARGSTTNTGREYFAMNCHRRCFMVTPPRVCMCCSTALCFTCAWYSSIVTVGLLHLLVVQVINISHNVTEREARAALREKTARSTYWGLVVDTGVYSRGFRGNWSEFLTMGDKCNAPSEAPTDLV